MLKLVFILQCLRNWFSLLISRFSRDYLCELKNAWRSRIVMIVFATRISCKNSSHSIKFETNSRFMRSLFDFILCYSSFLLFHFSLFKKLKKTKKCWKLKYVSILLNQIQNTFSLFLFEHDFKNRIWPLEFKKREFFSLSIFIQSLVSNNYIVMYCVIWSIFACLDKYIDQCFLASIDCSKRHLSFQLSLCL